MRQLWFLWPLVQAAGSRPSSSVQIRDAEDATTSALPHTAIHSAATVNNARDRVKNPLVLSHRQWHSKDSLMSSDTRSAVPGGSSAHNSSSPSWAVDSDADRKADRRNTETSSFAGSARTENGSERGDRETGSAGGGMAPYHDSGRSAVVEARQRRTAKREVQGEAITASGSATEKAHPLNSTITQATFRNLAQHSAVSLLDGGQPTELISDSGLGIEHDQSETIEAQNFVTDRAPIRFVTRDVEKTGIVDTGEAELGVTRRPDSGVNALTDSSVTVSAPFLNNDMSVASTTITPVFIQPVNLEGSKSRERRSSGIESRQETSRVNQRDLRYQKQIYRRFGDTMRLPLPAEKDSIDASAPSSSIEEDRTRSLQKSHLYTIPIRLETHVDTGPEAKLLRQELTFIEKNSGQHARGIKATAEKGYWKDKPSSEILDKGRIAENKAGHTAFGKPIFGQVDFHAAVDSLIKPDNDTSDGNFGLEGDKRVLKKSRKSQRDKRDIVVPSQNSFEPVDDFFRDSAISGHISGGDLDLNRGSPSDANSAAFPNKGFIFGQADSKQDTLSIDLGNSENDLLVAVANQPAPQMQSITFPYSMNNSGDWRGVRSQKGQDVDTLGLSPLRSRAFDEATGDANETAFLSEVSDQRWDELTQRIRIQAKGRDNDRRFRRAPSRRNRNDRGESRSERISDFWEMKSPTVTFTELADPELDFDEDTLSSMLKDGQGLNSEAGPEESKTLSFGNHDLISSFAIGYGAPYTADYDSPSHQPSTFYSYGCEANSSSPCGHDEAIGNLSPMLLLWQQTKKEVEEGSALQAGDSIPAELRKTQIGVNEEEEEQEYEEPAKNESKGNVAGQTNPDHRGQNLLDLGDNGGNDDDDDEKVMNDDDGSTSSRAPVETAAKYWANDGEPGSGDYGPAELVVKLMEQFPLQFEETDEQTVAQWLRKTGLTPFVKGWMDVIVNGTHYRPFGINEEIDWPRLLALEVFAGRLVMSGFFDDESINYMDGFNEIIATVAAGDPAPEPAPRLNVHKSSAHYWIPFVTKSFDALMDVASSGASGRMSRSDSRRKKEVGSVSAVDPSSRPRPRQERESNLSHDTDSTVSILPGLLLTIKKDYEQMRRQVLVFDLLDQGYFEQDAGSILLWDLQDETSVPSREPQLRTFAVPTEDGKPAAAAATEFTASDVSARSSADHSTAPLSLGGSTSGRLSLSSTSEPSEPAAFSESLSVMPESSTTSSEWPSKSTFPSTLLESSPSTSSTVLAFSASPGDESVATLSLAVLTSSPTASSGLSILTKSPTTPTSTSEQGNRSTLFALSSSIPPSVLDFSSTSSGLDSSTSSKLDSPTSSEFDSSTSSGLDSSTTSGLDSSTSSGLDSSTTSGPDSSTTSGLDSSTTSGPDSSTSSGLDPSTSSGPDSSTSSSLDSSTSSGLDSSTSSGFDSSTSSGLDSSTSSGFDSSTSSGFDSSTSSGLDPSTSSGIDSSTSSSLDSSTSSGLDSSTSSGLDSSTSSGLDSSTSSELDSSTSSGFDSSTSSGFDSSTSSGLDSTLSGFGSSTLSGFGSSTLSGFGSSTTSRFDSSTSSSLGSSISSSLDSSTSSGLGSSTSSGFDSSTASGIDSSTSSGLDSSTSFGLDSSTSSGLDSSTSSGLDSSTLSELDSSTSSGLDSSTSFGLDSSTSSELDSSTSFELDSSTSSEFGPLISSGLDSSTSFETSTSSLSPFDSSTSLDSSSSSLFQIETTSRSYISESTTSVDDSTTSSVQEDITTSSDIATTSSIFDDFGSSSSLTSTDTAVSTEKPPRPLIWIPMKHKDDKFPLEALVEELDLSTLGQAIRKNPKYDVLKRIGMTIFAPIDEAFDGVPVDINSIGDENKLVVQKDSNVANQEVAATFRQLRRQQLSPATPHHDLHNDLASREEAFRDIRERLNRSEQRKEDHLYYGDFGVDDDTDSSRMHRQSAVKRKRAARNDGNATEEYLTGERLTSRPPDKTDSPGHGTARREERWQRKSGDTTSTPAMEGSQKRRRNQDDMSPEENMALPDKGSPLKEAHNNPNTAAPALEDGSQEAPKPPRRLTQVNRYQQSVPLLSEGLCDPYHTGIPCQRGEFDVDSGIHWLAGSAFDREYRARTSHEKNVLDDFEKLVMFHVVKRIVPPGMIQSKKNLVLRTEMKARNLTIEIVQMDSHSKAVVVGGQAQIVEIVACKNGYIYKIDRPLFPAWNENRPTLLDAIKVDPRFSRLRYLVEKSKVFDKWSLAGPVTMLLLPDSAWRIDGLPVPPCFFRALVRPENRDILNKLLKWTTVPGLWRRTDIQATDWLPNGVAPSLAVTNIDMGLWQTAQNKRASMIQHQNELFDAHSPQWPHMVGEKVNVSAMEQAGKNESEHVNRTDVLTLIEGKEVVQWDAEFYNGYGHILSELPLRPDIDMRAILWDCMDMLCQECPIVTRFLLKYLDGGGLLPDVTNPKTYIVPPGPRPDWMCSSVEQWFPPGWIHSDWHHYVEVARAGHSRVARQLAWNGWKNAAERVGQLEDKLQEAEIHLRHLHRVYGDSDDYILAEREDPNLLIGWLLNRRSLEYKPRICDPKAPKRPGVILDSNLDVWDSYEHWGERLSSPQRSGFYDKVGREYNREIAMDELKYVTQWI